MGFNGSEFRENLAAITGQTMQLAFPGMRDAFRAIEEAAVEAIHVRAKEQELEDLFKGMRGEGGVLLGGRQRRNGSSEYAELDALSSRNSILNDILLQNVVLSLEEQIQLLDDEIATLEQEIAVINEKLATIDDIRELQSKGDLDPTNPEHRRMLEQVGADPDDDPAAIADQLNQAEQDLRIEGEEKARIVAAKRSERAQLTNVVTELQVNGVQRNADGSFNTASFQFAFDQTERELGAFDETNLEHQERLADNIILQAAVIRKDELELTNATTGVMDDTALSSEQRVEIYKHRLTEAQTIEDEQARLAAEKAIFDEINAEGMTFAFAAANDETLRPLFEPDHFENLEEVQVAANSTLESALTVQV